MFSKIILMLCMFCLFHLQGECQSLFIRHGHKKISLLKYSKIDIQTGHDTTGWETNAKKPRFTIDSLEKDSIKISRPVAWKDTFSYRFNAWNGKDKTDKKKYYKAPVEYESHRFGLSEITRIRYTYQRDQSRDGCVACYFIPGVNLYYIWVKAYRTREFDMRVWKFVWK